MLLCGYIFILSVASKLTTSILFYFVAAADSVFFPMYQWSNNAPLFRNNFVKILINDF